MKPLNILNMLIDIPKLVTLQAIQPLRTAMRKTVAQPKTAQELTQLVNKSLKHEIRAGYTHRFITILFVTVGDRVFCRRYSYGEPSWHSAFRADPQGQIKLDKTIVNVDGRIPDDLEQIMPAIDEAYSHKLKKIGARFLLNGAIEPRAQQSTMELTLSKP